MIIRTEKPGDESVIREINLSAFGQLLKLILLTSLERTKNVKGVAKYHPEFAIAV